jgi:prepilin-type N-terminal cleavage/methylation domain-containing protein
MKPSMTFRKRGFTLLETVIAIGVLSVLLTGFIVVFTPAAQGIKKSINVQQADRLASTLEQELVTLRSSADTDSFGTGFCKALDWIKNSNSASSALLAYQYRGNPSTLRADNTATPVASLQSKLPGKDYVVVSMLRRERFGKLSDEFSDDLKAVEGPVYVVKCTQLVFSGGNLILGKAGSIVDPKTGAAVISPSGYQNPEIAFAVGYPEAVISYAADFYQLPSSSASFVAGFTSAFDGLKNPVFTRNFAVGR